MHISFFFVVVVVKSHWLDKIRRKVLVEKQSIVGNMSVSQYMRCTLYEKKSEYIPVNKLPAAGLYMKWVQEKRSFHKSVLEKKDIKLNFVRSHLQVELSFSEASPLFLHRQRVMSVCPPQQFKDHSLKCQCKKIALNDT